MSFKYILTAALSAFIGLTSVNTQAASIWFEPVEQDIKIGGVATLNIWADASDVGGFLAGGFDVFVEEFPKDPTKIPVVTYNNDFAFDDSFPTDFLFSRTGDDCSANPALPGCSGPGEINGIAFYNVNGIAVYGATLVGTLSFTGMNLGYAVVYMTDNDYPAGSWFATDGTDLTGMVSYGSARINVVPLPAALWLMTGGLGVLLAFARKRNTALYRY